MRADWEISMADIQDLSKEVEFLQEKLKWGRDSFYKKRIINRRIAFWIKMATVAIGALTTIILGIKSYPCFKEYADALSISALCLSATVPVLLAWESFHDYRWLWIRYTSTANALYSISDDLEYAVRGGAITKKQLDDLYQRLQDTLQETNKAWSEKRVRDQADERKQEEEETPK
jgi:hypothetical protein